jgi:hypothetical protein
VRQLVLMVLQAAMLIALWWFIRHVYVPTFGPIGALVAIAGTLLLACWVDGMPWRYGVAFTLLATVNFAAFFAVLSVWRDWRGLLWTPAFLLFGYRLAGVIDGTAQRAAKPAAGPRWSPGRPNTPPMPPSTPAAAGTGHRAYTRPRFGRQ